MAGSYEEIQLQAGDPFPPIFLPSPKSASDRKYLGIGEKNTFQLKEVNADVILIELLNVHCMSCRIQAPVFNETFKVIEKNFSTAGKLKILGIAAGNGYDEVQSFKELLNIPFPILPDPEFSIYEAIGGDATPFSLYVYLDKHGAAATVIKTHLGVIEDYKQVFVDMTLLPRIKAASGSEKGGSRDRSEPSGFLPGLHVGEVENELKKAARETNGTLKQWKKLSLKSNPSVYLLEVSRGDREESFAAVEVNKRVSL